MSRGKPSIPVFNLRNDYTGTAVTTGAWVQLSASLGQDMCELEIFDSSGSAMQLGIGPSGSEVALPFMIMPGGNTPMRVSCLLNKGMRLAIKAVDVNASAGQLIINGYH